MSHKQAQAMNDTIWFCGRLALLMGGCGILGGWLWTELASVHPVHGGILSFPSFLSFPGLLIGMAVGLALFVWNESRRGMT